MRCCKVCGFPLLSWGLALLAPGALTSAVIEVNDTCTLNAAIEAANRDHPVGACPPGSGADMIVLTVDVLLTEVDNETDGPNGLPSIESTITIEGNDHEVGRDSDASDPFRILHVAESGDLTLNQLRIFGGWTHRSGGGIRVHGRLLLRGSRVDRNVSYTDGYSVSGGGLFVDSGARARVEGSSIHLNAAVGNGGVSLGHGFGGGVAASGSLEIVESTVQYNLATGYHAWGGGVYAGGEERTCLLARSLVRQNEAVALGEEWFPPSESKGGGVFSLSAGCEVRNSTFAGNRAETPALGKAEGGGFWGSGRLSQATFHGNEAEESGAAIYARGEVYVIGTLLADSTGDHCDGNVIDVAGSGNLADDSTCLPTIAGTLTGLDPVLSDNGGPTPTHALLPGSNAIDLAGDCGLPTDQRGAARAGSCDSGAYEEIGCPLLEFENQTITTNVAVGTCSTALLGPDLIIDSAYFGVQAGDLITLKDGFTVRPAAEVFLALDW